MSHPPPGVLRFRSILSLLQFISPSPVALPHPVPGLPPPCAPSPFGGPRPMDPAARLLVPLPVRPPPPHGLRPPASLRPLPGSPCIYATPRPAAGPLVLTRRGAKEHGSRTSRRSVICASLFGVGAPEALVIGVVALLVFGPKGLAEVARNLGKTLRAFQPTIRELQDVSREFRSTLEREIGIDEVPPSTNYSPTTTNNSQQPAANPNVKVEAAPYTSEELMKVTEEQIAASAAAAWDPQQPASSQQQEAASTTQSEDAATSGGSDGPAAPAPTVNESNPSQANQSEKVET